LMHLSASGQAESPKEASFLVLLMHTYVLAILQHI
jgi:hypothetical protein